MANIISSVSLTKLFGYIDLELTELNQIDDQFLFLYAENGLGKTTLLNLIYSLVSSIKNEGNKSYLYSQVFEKCLVKFSSGASICAERGGGATEGDYELKFEFPVRNVQIKSKVKSDEAGRVNSITSPGLREFMESVTEFLPPIIYLGADRYVRSSSREEDEHNYRNYLVPNDYLMPSDWQKSRRDNDTLQIFKQIQIGNLASQIRAFEASITQEFINSQSFGLRSSEQIIQRVLRDVSAGKQNRAVINKTQAIKQLQQLKEDAIPAFQYGFDSVEPIDKTLQLIESVAEEQWQRVSAVVGTYVETNLTKYGYLIALSNRVTEFLHELSSYFLDKEITFSRREGLNIKNKITNTEIAPAKLSSGERQLITMFALVSIRRQEPTVVLIDEPEISLSSLWQRKLSKSFSVVSDKEQTQFLIATHSIEILSDKANKVVSPVIREF